MKVPPALVKAYLRNQPVHGALQACKAVDKFFHYCSEYVELREHDFSERRRERVENNIQRYGWYFRTSSFLN